MKVPTEFHIVYQEWLIVQKKYAHKTCHVTSYSCLWNIFSMWWI